MVSCTYFLYEPYTHTIYNVLGHTTPSLIVSTKDSSISGPTFQNSRIASPPDMPPSTSSPQFPSIPDKRTGNTRYHSGACKPGWRSNTAVQTLGSPLSTHRLPPSSSKTSLVSPFRKRSWTSSIGTFEAFGLTNWLIRKLGPNSAQVTQSVSRSARNSAYSSKGSILGFASAKAIGRLPSCGKATGPRGRGIIILTAPPSPPRTLRGALGENATVLTKKETPDLSRNTRGRRSREGNL